MNGASILRVIFSNCMTLMDAHDKADEKDGTIDELALYLLMSKSLPAFTSFSTFFNQ